MREESAEQEPGQLDGSWMRCQNPECRKWRLVAKDCLPALREDGFRRGEARRVDAEYDSWRSWLEGAEERYEMCLAAQGVGGSAVGGLSLFGGRREGHERRVEKGVGEAEEAQTGADEERAGMEGKAAAVEAEEEEAEAAYADDEEADADADDEAVVE